MSRLEQIEKMLASEPQDIFLNFSLAMEYVKAGRHADAIVQFSRVSEIDPDYVPAYFQKGTTFVAMGQPQDAKAALTEGVEAAQRIGDTHAVGEMSELLQALG